MLKQDAVAHYLIKLQAITNDVTMQPSDKILKLFRLFEGFLDDMTRDETISLRNAFEKTHFLQERYNLSPEEMANINAFRKIRNNVVHYNDSRKFKPLPTSYDCDAAIALIYRLIEHFSSKPIWIPANISALHTISLAKSSQKKQHPHIDILHAFILKIDTRYPNQTSLYCAIDNQEDFQAEYPSYMWISVFERHHRCDTLWQFARIDITNLEAVQNYEAFYTTTDQTTLIIDPDCLMNVSDIATCFYGDSTIYDDFTTSNALLYIMRLFSPMSSSPSLLLGNIVNAFLDNIVNKQHNLTDALFIKAIKDNALAYALLSTQEQEVLKRDAFTHFKNIQAAISPMQRFQDRIEPTFLSSRFGLRGRLDLMFSHTKEATTQDIIELKSSILWKGKIKEDYRAQLAGYDLLLESTFGERKGVDALLYSKESSNTLRSMPRNLSLQEQVLSTRNVVVAYEHQLRSKDYTCLSTLSSASFGEIPPYTMKNLQGFQTCYNDSASVLDRSFFHEYVSFVAREHHIAKVGPQENREDPDDFGFADLWHKTLFEKEQSYAILSFLQYVSSTTKMKVITFAFDTNKENISDFRVGDIAVLYPMNQDGTLTPLRHQIIRCMIKDIKQNYVSVDLYNEATTHDYLDKHTYWAIERDMLDLNYTNMYKSLYSFLGTTQHKKELLYGQEQPKFDKISIHVIQGLNAKQQELVGRAANAQDYFLVQGPPGTGKTSRFLRELVRYLFEHTEDNIVILAFTNRAVNEICKALMTISSAFPFLILSPNQAYHSHTLSKALEKIEPDEYSDALKQVRVYISTVASFQTKQHDLQKIKHFHMAIIDEASQLLEPQLVGILSSVDRFVLIGDEKQLPAVVTQSETATKMHDPELTRIGITDMRTSLFERLLVRCKEKGWDAYGQLEEQYRMHESILAFPNATFYDGSLRTGITLPTTYQQAAFSATSVDETECQLARARVIFYPISGGGNKRSKEEAEQVVRIIQTIQHTVGIAGVEEENRGRKLSVGIITPFRLQVAEISRQIRKLPQQTADGLLDKIMIDTVERFQGSEYDIIIISFAVNSPQRLRLMESLNLSGTVDRKLNVALTRAKQHLIMLGDESALRTGKFTGKLLAHVKIHGGYIGAIHAQQPTILPRVMRKAIPARQKVKGNFFSRMFGNEQYTKTP